MKTKNAITPELRALVGPFSKIARTMSRNHKVQIVARGMGVPETDGDKVIYIPFTADYLPADKRQKLHGILDHEVGHVVEERRHREAGKKTPIDHIKEIIDAKGRHAKSKKLIFNALEDMRMEKLWGAQYPGVGENLSELNKDCGVELRNSLSSNPNVSPWFQIVMAASFRASGEVADWVSPLAEPYVSAILPEFEEAFDVPWGDDVRRLTDAVFEKLKDLAKEKTDEEGDDPKKRNTKKKAKHDSADGAGERDEDSSEGKSSGDSDSEETKFARALLSEGSDIADPLEQVKLVLEDFVKDDAVTHRRYVPHPESLARDYWETPAPLPGYEDSKADVASQIGALRRRQLVKLQTLTKARVVTGLDEGDLDGGELPHVRMGRTNVFSDIVRNRLLDVSIGLLIDCSGSMRSDNPMFPAYYAKRTAIALAESWEMLRGVDYTVMGWTNPWNTAPRVPAEDREHYIVRSCFRYFMFKDWHEKLSHTRGRFEHIVGHDENADGEAVMMAAERVASRPQKRKMLIVISDGYPSCHGIPGDLSYSYLKEVCKRIESIESMQLLGVGAGTDAPKQFYKNHIVVDNLQYLASRVFNGIDQLVRGGVA